MAHGKSHRPRFVNPNTDRKITRGLTSHGGHAGGGGGHQTPGGPRNIREGGGDSTMSNSWCCNQFVKVCCPTIPMVYSGGGRIRGRRYEQGGRMDMRVGPYPGPNPRQVGGNMPMSGNPGGGGNAHVAISQLPRWINKSEVQMAYNVMNISVANRCNRVNPSLVRATMNSNLSQNQSMTLLSQWRRACPALVNEATRAANSIDHNMMGMGPGATKIAIIIGLIILAWRLLSK